MDASKRILYVLPFYTEGKSMQRKSETANRIVLGLPKGSLQEATFTLMRKAGYVVTVSSRAYMPAVNDPEIEARLIRAQEISRYVEHGMLDAGITGHDWIVENGSDVVEVVDLIYAKQGLRPVRWVVAVPTDSSIKTVNDLAGKRIATEAVGLTKRFLKKRGIHAEVEFSWGATEVKAPELVDAIVELTETGSSLRANNLRIVETVLESTTKLIVSKTSWKNAWKRAKIERLALMLQGALTAETMVLLKMNAREKDVKNIAAILPALNSPTVNALNEQGWVAIESVVKESVVREIIPALKEAGAHGIIELALNKVVP